MRCDLRVAERDWQLVRRHLDVSFRSEEREELGLLVLLGDCAAKEKYEYLVAEVVIPRPGEVEATSESLRFTPSYLRRAHLRMRERKLAGLGAFHTHPRSTDSVRFSPYDNQKEPSLIQNLVDIYPQTRLVSVVLGSRALQGRHWGASSARPEPLSRLIVVGERIEMLHLDGRTPPPPPPLGAIFDRGAVLTGGGALQHLANMTVAVVGASGTGSVVCELLIRAGCRRLVIVDDDRVRLVNLNRILHATLRDAENAHSKVLVLERAALETGFPVEIEPIHGTILDKRVLHLLGQADVLVGCVDKAWPRDLLCQFASQYLKPFIDVGSEIGTDKSRTAVFSVDARASYFAPGRPCLRCTGIATPRALHFESLSAPEREREIQLGYSDELLMDQPAVMDLNMRAASWGMMLLRHLLQPFLMLPLPLAITENLVTYSTRQVKEARAANPLCPVCQKSPTVGYGDQGPRLGLDESALKRVTGA